MKTKVKTRESRKTLLGKQLLLAANEVLAHVRGEKRLLLRAYRTQR